MTGEVGFKSPTFWFVDDPLYFLSLSRPIKILWLHFKEKIRVELGSEKGPVESLDRSERVLR